MVAQYTQASHLKGLAWRKSEILYLADMPVYTLVTMYQNYLNVNGVDVGIQMDFLSKRWSTQLAFERSLFIVNNSNMFVKHSWVEEGI